MKEFEIGIPSERPLGKKALELIKKRTEAEHNIKLGKVRITRSGTDWIYRWWVLNSPVRIRKDR